MRTLGVVPMAPAVGWDSENTEARSYDEGGTIPVGFNPILVLSFSEASRRLCGPSQQFSITLPHDMAEAVGSKIKSGAYASVSEVCATACAPCWSAMQRFRSAGFRDRSRAGGIRNSSARSVEGRSSRRDPRANQGAPRIA